MSIKFIVKGMQPHMESLVLGPALKHCVVGVISEEKEFSCWGVAGVPFLLTRSLDQDVWQGSTAVVKHSSSSRGAPFEFRLVVWNIKVNRIEAVDCTHTLPEVITPTTDHRDDSGVLMAVIDVACTPGFALWPRSKLRCVPTKSHLLRLSLFTSPVNTRFDIDQVCEPEEKKFLPVGATGRLEIIGDGVESYPCGKWSYYSKRQPPTTTPFSPPPTPMNIFEDENEGGDENEEEGDHSSTILSQRLRAKSELAVVEALATVEPVSSPLHHGIRDQYTARYWTITYDVSELVEFAPCFRFRSLVPPMSNKQMKPTSKKQLDNEESDHHHHKEGTFTLLPSMFKKLWRGNFVVAAVSDDRTFIAPIEVDFIFVSPLLHPQNNLRLIRSTQSEAAFSPRTFIGHRGLGHTLHRYSKNKLTENTIESLTAAFRRGCQFVEFDVMLTKDNIPVVYHDSILAVQTKEKKRKLRKEIFAASRLNMTALAESPVDRFGMLVNRKGDEESSSHAGHSLDGTGQFESVPVGVHQLTRRQLEGIEVHAARQRRRLYYLLCKHWESILRLARSMVETPRTSSSSTHVSFAQLEAIPNRIPSFADLLRILPKELGLLVEVKFPFQPLADDQLYLQHHFEINKWIDVIVLQLLIGASSRENIAFCSFHPTVCIALAMKQAHFPVVFLCDRDLDDLNDYRSYGTETALQFATAESLNGVSLNSLSLLSASDQKRAKPTKPLSSFDPLNISRDSVKYPDHSNAWESNWKNADFSKGKDIMDYAQKHHMLVWTWGPANDDHCWCLTQKDQLKVSGVITDNVPTVVASGSTIVSPSATTTTSTASEGSPTPSVESNQYNGFNGRAAVVQTSYPSHNNVVVLPSPDSVNTPTSISSSPPLSQASVST